jgi:1-acyl-sn-glycerol-3-phosphate acyltransferase
MVWHKDQPPYRVAFHYRIMRLILRPLFRLLFRILCRVRVTGLENVPRRGAYLIAINHPSLFEPPFVLAFWPQAPEAAGAVEIWERPGQNVLVRLYGAIPVHRGEYDRKLIDAMVSALRSGKPLLLAPEGGRTHSPAMRRALPGAAHIVDQADVLVLPVGAVGTSDDLLKKAMRGERPLIEMRIGKPFRLPPLEGRGEARRAQRQRNADLIMLRIAALLPPEYHGYYAGLNLHELGIAAPADDPEAWISDDHKLAIWQEKDG